MTGMDDEKQRRTHLDDNQIQILKDALWHCDIAGISFEAKMAYINSGILGYLPLTKHDVAEAKANNTKPKRKPITIGSTKVKEVQRELFNPETMNKELYDFGKKGFIKVVVSIMKMMQFGNGKTMQNAMAAQDIKTSQFVVNSMFRNSVYMTQFSDVVRRIIQNKMLPLSDEEIKVLESTFGK